MNLNPDDNLSQGKCLYVCDVTVGGSWWLWETIAFHCAALGLWNIRLHHVVEPRSVNNTHKTCCVISTYVCDQFLLQHLIDLNFLVNKYAEHCHLQKKNASLLFIFMLVNFFLCIFYVLSLWLTKLGTWLACWMFVSFIYLQSKDYVSAVFQKYMILDSLYADYFIVFSQLWKPLILCFLIFSLRDIWTVMK